MGLFLLGKGNKINQHNWIWALYYSIMVKLYMYQTAYPQRNLFEEGKFSEIAKF